MRALHQCLLDTDLIRLRVIARFWDVELAANRRRDVAAELADAMTALEVVASAWEALPDGQRRALGALLAAGGMMPLRVFARDWGEIRTMGPGRMEREQPWREPASPAEGLWYRGLIYRTFDQGPDGAYEVVFVPPELLAYLPAPFASPPATTLAPTDAPAVTRSAGDALLDDACTLLAYLQNEKLRPESDGGLPIRHKALLAPRLRDPDPARLDLLSHLVQHLGWLRMTDAGHLRPDPGPVTAWLQFPADRQRQALVEAWRDDPAWNDLFHVPSLRPEDTGAWRNDPVLARKAILSHLESCAPFSWYRLDDFVSAVKQADPDFQRPGGDYTTWYICDATTGAYLSGFENWDEIEGALIRYLVTGPLAWLGMTDTALAGTHTVFRLTATGAALLGLAEASAEPEPGPTVLVSDFTVRVPPTRRYDRFQLARVADWVSSPPLEATEEGKSFFVYRLTPASLTRARQQGIPVARVLEFLGRAVGEPMPRFVEAALTRWEVQGSEARLEQAVLLRFASEEAMTQAMSFPPIRRLIREQIGPTVALVHKTDWPRLVVALGEMGLMPDIIDLEENHAK
jgi:hypothetical protein